jgi:hypothetical protein
MGASGELEVVFYETNSANEEIILSSNVLASVIGINIPENSWSAGTTNLNGSIAYPTSSFLVPLQPAATLVETNFGFLQSTTGFDGVQGGFHNVSNTIPILRWWLRSRYRVRFLLLDASVSPMRVVDYVSLSRDEEPVDVTFKLAGNIPIGNYGDGSQHGGWYTNRLGDSQSESAPTAGILNQIGIGLGFIFPGSRWRANDAAIRAAGSIANAIEFFEYNLRDLLITPNPQIYKTNVFHAPYDPSLAIYQHLSLQANDPLVRLTLPDLIDPILNRVDFVSDNPALPDIRRVNVRYRPWGASSRGVRSGNASDFDRANKDARVFQSDDWQFPTNLPNDLTRFGQIHRGTPWQTIYLKSDDVNTNSDNAFWRGWTGYTDPADAALTRPVNDWRVASHLVSRLNTNDPHALLSPNVADTNAWLNALNGIIVITNSGIALPGRTLEFNEVVMTSNSPQAASIAGDINLSRISQPSQRFEYPGGVFATPALSCGSPWLNLDSLHLRFGATDEAYEMVPSQLLPMLRLDSIGSTIRSGNQLTVRFTGCDDYLYVVQVSSNLTDWISIHTNRPVDGILAHTDTLAPGSTRRFYRSLLVP